MKTSPRSIQKVLLIYPFTVTDSYQLTDIRANRVELNPPLGLGYLRSYLHAHLSDISVEIYDANAKAVKRCLEDNEVDMPALWAMVREKIRAYAPDLVGVSCLFHATAAPAHHTLALAKEIGPSIYTVIGGNYAHISYDEALKDTNIDFVVFSEGEVTFTNLITTINLKQDLRTLSGVAYRTECQEVIKTSPQPLIADLDEIPECDRSPFDLDFYSQHGRYFFYRFLERATTRCTTILASRGCPLRCTFCSARLTWGGKIRYRHPMRVVDEMLRLQERYGINAFIFVDDNMSANKQALMKLADEIRRRIPGIAWVELGGMMISTLDDELIHALYESGCKWFILPCESGSNATLKKIRKSHTIETVSRVIASIRRFPATWVAGNIITGFPFESKADIEESLAYAKTLDLDWLYLYRFMPLPGTPLYQECLDAGYLRKYTWTPEKIGELDTLSTPNFDADYIFDRNYATNADYNFFENRNIQIRPETAIHDFHYVLESVEDHPLSMYGLGCAYRQLQNYSEAERWFANTLELLAALTNEQEQVRESNVASISKSFFVVKNFIDYSLYFRNAGIDVRKCLDEVRQLAQAQRSK